MLNKLLTLVILIPVIAGAQKGYISTSPTVDIGKGAGLGVGFALGANMALGNSGMYIGGTAGVVKFDGIKKAYIPLLFNFSVIPKGKTVPVFFFQPGLGIYKSATWPETTGGFTLFTGAGIAFTASEKAKFYFAGGYSRYGFTVFEQRADLDMIGIRFGAMLH